MISSEVSCHLVKLLRADEARYLDVTVALTLDIAAMDRFPNLERQIDGADKVASATVAVAELRRWTAKQREVIEEHEAHAVAIAESAKQAQDGRVFTQAHEDSARPAVHPPQHHTRRCRPREVIDANHCTDAVYCVTAPEVHALDTALSSPGR
ncbi:hypothetical protein [Streptomyces sp. NPDC058424]|uniref:hypothetical protein n=1 Tax=Streptomyces sp. NPDC058424 TaxID=3346491 RepID=UPI003652DF8F